MVVGFRVQCFQTCVLLRPIYARRDELEAHIDEDWINLHECECRLSGCQILTEINGGVWNPTGCLQFCEKAQARRALGAPPTFRQAHFPADRAGPEILRGSISNSGGSCIRRSGPHVQYG